MEGDMAIGDMWPQVATLYQTQTRRPASSDRTARAANFRRAGLIGDVGL